jgi:RHS repeat-associated core domain protein
VMENRYRYDAVDNILGITNAADPTSLTRLNKAKLGGRSHYGANGTGRFADCILWIQEFDLGNVDNTVQRDYMGDNYGSFNIFVSDNQLYVELRLDVTNRSEDALSETIAHELALHGSYISKCVEAYRENKDNPVKASEIISRMMSQDPHGNKDHADLKDNNQSNIGVVNYLNTMKEMGLKPQKQVKE